MGDRNIHKILKNKQKKKSTICSKRSMYKGEKYSKEGKHHEKNNMGRALKDQLELPVRQGMEEQARNPVRRQHGQRHRSEKQLRVRENQ